MVTEDELKDDEEYEDIVEDMRGEGGKYGMASYSFFFLVTTVPPFFIVRFRVIYLYSLARFLLVQQLGPLFLFYGDVSCYLLVLLIRVLLAQQLPKTI